MDNKIIKIVKVLENNKNQWLNQCEIGLEMSVYHSNLTLPLRKLRELFLQKQTPPELGIRAGFKNHESKIELHVRPRYYYCISD